jgi:protease II
MGPGRLPLVRSSPHKTEPAAHYWQKGAHHEAHDFTCPDWNHFFGNYNGRSKPPAARLHEVTDIYFGVTVAHLDRWMEDSASSEFPSFLDRQQEFTSSVLGRIRSQRDALLARILELQNDVADVRDVQRIGNQYFYLEAAPGSQDRSLMTRAVSGGAARRLLDPARLAPAGTHAITYFQPSWEGKYVAVGVSWAARKMRRSELCKQPAASY